MKARALTVALTIVLWLSLWTRAKAQEEIPQERVKKAAELAKEAAKGDEKKFIETFSAAVQLPEALDGNKPSDELARKRNATLLWAGRPEDSIYENPRFQELYPSLIRDSASGRRIFGGKPAKTGEFNTCVAIGNDSEYFCSGTLIGKRLVCTAGHCFEDQPTKVFVGDSVATPGREYRIRDGGLVRHTNYHLEQVPHNDLTLLILEKDVEGVAPIKIASTPACDAMKTVRIVGFGNTNKGGSQGYGTKRVADVIVVSPDGVRFQGSKYGADPGLEFVAEDRHADSCTGDSGGPAFLAGATGNWSLAGATSRATVAASVPCGDGGIYVRMDKYLPWIQQIARHNNIALPQ
jgi:secreted trypsin-like serine protease